MGQGGGTGRKGGDPPLLIRALHSCVSYFHHEKINYFDHECTLLFSHTPLSPPSPIPRSVLLSSPLIYCDNTPAPTQNLPLPPLPPPPITLTTITTQQKYFCTSQTSIRAILNTTPCRCTSRRKVDAPHHYQYPTSQKCRSTPQTSTAFIL